MLENNWVTSQYPRMGNISSKFPGGSMILPLLNNFVFLRPINLINYCKWFTLAKKSTEISGGNQSLLNLNLSCFVTSIFSLVRSYICLSCCYPYILNFTNIHQHYRFFLSVSLFDSGIRIWFNETHLFKILYDTAEYRTSNQSNARQLCSCSNHKLWKTLCCKKYRAV